LNDLGNRLAQSRAIATPNRYDDANGAPTGTQRLTKMFSRNHERRTITGAIGPSLPPGAPNALAEAVIHVSDA
jgi:hypothetical protein